MSKHRIEAEAVLCQSSYDSQDDLRLHFGLGLTRKVERISADDFTRVAGERVPGG
jgi:ASPIC/UnbV protein